MGCADLHWISAHILCMLSLLNLLWTTADKLEIDFCESRTRLSDDRIVPLLSANRESALSTSRGKGKRPVSADRVVDALAPSLKRFLTLVHSKVQGLFMASRPV